MPQHSTMLRIISKICGEGRAEQDSQHPETQGAPWAAARPAHSP